MNPRDHTRSEFEPSCPLCLELESGELDPRYQRYTQLRHRCVSRAGGVAIIPSIAPLRRGHLLVVPERHVTAAAHTAAETRQALLDAVEHLAAEVRARGAEPLAFEHGVGRGCEGGCGIQHAHLHLLPVSPRERATAEADFERSFATSSAGSLGEALDGLPGARSYGLLGLPESLLATAEELPSQTLRRCVARAIGAGSMDWRDLGSWDVMEETFAALAA